MSASPKLLAHLERLHADPRMKEWQAKGGRAAVASGQLARIRTLPLYRVRILEHLARIHADPNCQARFREGRLRALADPRMKKWASQGGVASARLLRMRNPTTPELMLQALAAETGYSCEPEHHIAQGFGPTDLAVWLDDGRCVAVELDGGGHFAFHPDQAERDARKDASVRTSGWVAVRGRTPEECLAKLDALSGRGST